MAQVDQGRDAVEIGENLRKARERAGMSQLDLGNELGTNAASVSRYEAGNQSMTVVRLCQMADILQVSPMMILPRRYAAERNALMDSVFRRLNGLPQGEQAKALEMMDVILKGLSCQYEQLRLEA